MTSWKAVVDIGATFTQSFFYYDGSRVVDLSGWTGVFRFRNRAGAVLLELGAANELGSLLVDGTLGKLILSVSVSGSGRLTGATGTYELEVSNGSTTLRLLDGPAQYRQLGAGSLDSVNVLIRRDTRSVTVERGTTNQIFIVDRGPPGPTGPLGPAGPIVPVTYVANGAMISTDKINHDRTWTQCKFAPQPSGDVTGATDTAALQALAVAAKIANVGILLYPGVYYVNDEIDISGSSVYLEGAACGAYGLNSGTCIEDVRAVRTADKYIIRAQDSWSHAHVKRISFAVNRSHGIMFMGLVSGQPRGNIIDQCFFSARAYIAATSASNLTCSVGVKVVNYTGATAAWDGVAPTFTAGTRIWLGSRSGVRAHMVGTIAAWNGTSQFTFTADECWDTDGTTVDPGLSGAHTDWDIRFPCEGFVCPVGANTTIDNILFTGLYCGVRASGGYNITIGSGCNIALGTALGPQFVADNLASGLIIRSDYEPGIGGWNHFIWLKGVYNALLSPSTGDPGPRGSLIYLDGSLNTEICNGTLSKNGGDASAIIRARGTDGLAIRDCEMLIGVGGCVVDFGSSSNNYSPTIDCPRIAQANLYRGTAFTHLNYRDTSGTWTLDWIYTGFAKFRYGYQRESSAINVAYGANNTLSVTNGLTYLTASGAPGPIEIRGSSPGLDGQVARVRSTIAQYLTLAHNHASASDKKFASPTARDVVYAPVAAGGFVEWEMEYDATLGQVKVLPLTPPIAPGVQSGTTTLVAGVSPAVACYLSANSVVTWGLEAPAGTALTIEYAALAANRSNGTPGSFKITALIAAGTIDAANTSTLRWTVTSP